MHRCSGIRPDGSRCERIVSLEQEYCYGHDPARVEERKRNAARGGKAKANQDLTDIKRRLRTLADDVLEGRVDKGVGAVVANIWGTYLKVVGMELDIEERRELIRRLEEVEERVHLDREAGQWGA